MSRSLILKTAAVSLVGLSLGAGFMSLQNQKPAPSLGRKIASVSDKTDRPPLMMGKHLSVVQVAVQAPEGIPNDENQEVTLVGYVRLNQPVDRDLNFRWELPEGVHVVEGQQEDAWSNVQTGQTAETRLKVTGFAKDALKLVVLHGYIRSGEAEFGNSAVLTSRPEDSYEMLSSASAGSQKMGLPEESRSLLKGKILR